LITKTQGNIIRILWNEGKDVGTISKVSDVPREGVYHYVGNHRDACPPRKRSPKSIDWETVTCAWYEVEKRGTPVKDVAEMFAARSQRWTNHFDRATLLMRGRGANGTWREPFDPTKRTYCTQRGGDYTESNAREYTWFVPHDPTGLIEALGGKDMFVRELSDFFWKHREYRHDNEPGHQAPYQFGFAGRPDLTARIVR
jgi:hypothetical protein